MMNVSEYVAIIFLPIYPYNLPILPKISSYEVNLFMRKSTGSEQKQHLMLSREADMIVQEDSLNFLGCENRSGCINRIIRNFRETSPASISFEIEHKRSYYSEVLSSISRNGLSEKGRNAVIDALIRKDIEECRKRIQAYPKEKSCQIRLQNDLYEDLYPDQAEGNWQEKNYYQSQGAYIKALVEEYAALSVYDREEIFFKDLLLRLRTAISLPREEARILRIKYQTASSKIIDCRIKPFDIVADQARQYHYLIALSRPVGSKENKYDLASFRISRIKEDSIYEYARSQGKGGISNLERDKISRILKDKGAQFLRDSEETIKVRLSRQGIELFESQYYMRPANSSITAIEVLEEGGAVYSFKCTRRQIEYYFFKFGKEAVVTEPPEFSISLRDKYMDAASAYAAESHDIYKNTQI